MKKLYTSNHKNISTCEDFEFKFKDFLNHLFSVNRFLYDNFTSNDDFVIIDVGEFKKLFNDFFQKWLKEKFDYELTLSVEDVTYFVFDKKTTDKNFDELFANYNFFKRLNYATDSFYIYDISIDQDSKYTIIVRDKPLLKN